MRTVIFDLDGTLADTGADLIAAANACFRDLGHGDLLVPGPDTGTALKGGRAMLRLGYSRVGDVDETVVDAQYPRLLAHYGENIDTHTVLYPGVERAVRGLSDTGYAVGICTNKPAGLAETLMTRLGARDWFGSLIGADTLPVRKPDPEPFYEAVRRAGGDPAQALLVGDTLTDLATARNAGAPCILVTFGPDGETVRGMTADGFLAHFDDLGDAVRGLIG